jgi:hypothetical protein
LLTARVAQTSLNVAMKANPIGAIITGITVLAGGIYWMATHWDLVKQKIGVVWNFIKVYNPITQLFRPIFYLFPAVKQFFGDVWNFLTKWIKKAWEGIKWLWDKIKDFLGFGETKIDVKAGVEMLKEEAPDKSNPMLSNKLDPNFIPDAKVSGSGSGGGGHARNVTIQITNLVGEIKIVSNSVKEALPEIKRMFSEALIAEVRDAEMMLAGG